jgi:hypothetical protein
MKLFLVGKVFQLKVVKIQFEMVRVLKVFSIEAD